MNYKMIVLDMDGTLLTKDKRIANETSEAIKKATDAGLIVIIATGRAIQGVEMYPQLTALNTPIILSNGAQIYNSSKKKYIHNKLLPAEPAAKALAAGSKFGTTMCIWCGGNLYGNIMNDNLHFYERLSGTTAQLMPDESVMLDEGITKILWFDTEENISKYAAVMSELLGDTSACCRTAPEFLEFFNTEVSKGEALDIIAKSYGVRREEIIAIGDGENDIEMIEYAGLGIAMGNAPEVVKAHADFITKPNYENGVAYAINMYINKSINS